MLERLAPRGHAQLPHEALHMRAERVLGDVEALGDLVRAEMVVEQQEYLELTRRECGGDRIGDARVAAVAVSNLVEQPARDRSREGSLTVRDAVEKCGDALRRLRLEQVAGRARTNRREEVVL